MLIGVCADCHQDTLIDPLTRRPSPHLTPRSEGCFGDHASNLHDPSADELAEVLFRTRGVRLPTGEVFCLAM